MSVSEEPSRTVRARAHGRCQYRMMHESRVNREVPETRE
jgi:hypothetical protein